MDLLIGLAIGYVAAQFLSVAKLKAAYAAVKAWLATLRKDGVGEADEYKVGGSSSDD